MAQVQGVDYNSIENELGFDLNELGAQRFHADKYQHTKTLEDIMNNNNASEEASIQDLSSSWLNEFTSVEDGELFGCDVVNNEMTIDANEGFPNEIDSEDLANGLSISYLNNWMVDTSLSKVLESHTSFAGNETAGTNNGQIIGVDFAFSNLNNFVNEDKTSSKKRKATATLTNCDKMDSFMEQFDEIEQDIRDPLVELSNFKTSQSRQSDLLGLRRKRNTMASIQADTKRKRAKTSDTVDAGEVITMILASSKAKMQSSEETGRGRNRNAKTAKNRRSETDLETDFDDLSPVSSPEAEVPRSPLKSDKIIDDEELVTLDTKNLNKRVKYLPKATVREIKHRRRTLKNRGYARSCREKKIDEASSLQKSNIDLEKELASKCLELKMMKFQCCEWKQKYEQLFLACKARGIKV